MSNDSAAIQRILVATDFSPHSDAALQKALHVARASGAELTLLHVLTDLRTAMADMSYEGRWQLVGGDLEKFQKELYADSEKKLTDQLARLDSSGVVVHKQSEMGTAYIKIIQVVQQVKSDLVVVGTRGVTGLQRMVVGSTAERLLRHCPAPVWIVKSESAGALKKVLVATDFSPVSGHALQVAAQLARGAQAELDVIHVIESAESIVSAEQMTELGLSVRKINNAAKKQFADFTHAAIGDFSEDHMRVVKGKPWKAISDQSRRMSVDLIVLGTVGRSGIPGILLGNTAEKVLQNSKCDMLAVKPVDFVSSIEPSVQVT